MNGTRSQASRGFSSCSSCDPVKALLACTPDLARSRLPLRQVSRQQALASLRTRFHIGGLELRVLLEGVVQGIAHEHRHPATHLDRASIALHQRVFAGHEEAE